MSALGPGDSIAGRYRLVEELGAGGMGVVFRARDGRSGRDVAVKILRVTGLEATRRLRREARATEGLDPDRVARVHEIGETSSGEPFLVMEYVEGRTLRAILREGAVERPEALRILREIAITLAGAHKLGLLHRDVKPDNVLVRADGHVVLLDFGIAKHLHPSEDASQVTTQLTSEGAMIGTPAYLAPEQALGRDVDAAADQFALAVTAFQLLTGKLPWSGGDVTSMLAQLLAETPPAASTLNPGVPRSFDAVLWRALSKSPGARFPSVEAFVDALDAAERGVNLLSPASRTLEGPLASVAGQAFEGHPPAAVTPPPPRLAAPKPRRWRGAWMLLAAAVALGGGVLLLRSRATVAHQEIPRAGSAAAAALVVSTQTPLACPIFVVEGAPEIAPRLAAAAGALACARAKWYLGGSNEKVLVPAALLDAPVQPRPDLWDFYDAPGLRARTLDVVKARGLPSLDGTVTRGRDSWRVDLAVHAPDGSVIARSAGVEAPYFELAIRNAVIRLWQTSPLAPAKIDPDVALWAGYSDIDAGLIELDLNQAGATIEACESVKRRGLGLGSGYYYLSQLCDLEPLVDAGALVLDESSGPALLASLSAILVSATTNPFSSAEMRRLALKLESMRASETSRFGRASLGRFAGILWSLVPDVERAHAALLSAVGDDPLLLNEWYHLLYFARGTGSSEPATSLAAVWFPQESPFMRSVSPSDDLEVRLRDSQLAYTLAPSSLTIRRLGRALAEAGRAEEVRALIVTTPPHRSAPDPKASTYLLGCIDLHDAMLARALTRFEEGGADGLKMVPILAEVLGRTSATAARWAAPFVGATDPNADAISPIGAAVVAMCMNAGDPLAGRCLSRVEKLGAAVLLSFGVGGDHFLLGAKRFAAHDVRGAVDAWRPIVAGPNDDLARLLPTEAFERSGEHDLAARIDARKMRYRQIAGVSEAAPREAARAFERGDRARAKELAKAVLQAWEVADTVVPAVAEMRALLVKIGN